MELFLKISAFVCKILAAIIWLGSASLTIAFPTRHDWGAPAFDYLDIVLCLVAVLLAITPNHWLVSSRTAFSISVIIALLPFCLVLIHDWWSDPFMSVRNYLDPGALVFAAFIFGPLPLSLALSFWRHQKGAKVTYA
jgi:hypothetical protein